MEFGVQRELLCAELLCASYQTSTVAAYTTCSPLSLQMRHVLGRLISSAHKSGAAWPSLVNTRLIGLGGLLCHDGSPEYLRSIDHLGSQNSPMF